MADDQLINIQVLKGQLTQLGYLKNCEFCYDGAEAIKKTKLIIETAPDEETLLVSLMLLDF